MKNILQTKEYHVHVYYELHQLKIAHEVRDQLMREIPQIDGVGPLRKGAVGPHPTPMFEAWFTHQHLNTVIEWMEQNRRGLSVMFHPLSGDDLADHEQHCFWLGTPLPLRLEIFR